MPRKTTNGPLPRIVVAADEIPTAPEILERHIIEISDSMKKLIAGPIKTDTLIVLIQEACGKKISRADIRTVMFAIERLREAHCKK